MIRLTLPVPPSVNNLYRNVRGRGRIKTAEYLSWEQAAKLQLQFQAAKIRFRAPQVPTDIVVRVGKVNQARDLDNFLKPAVDSLVKAGIIRGDNLTHVHRVTSERAFGAVRDGWIEICVAHIAESEAAA